MTQLQTVSGGGRWQQIETSADGSTLWHHQDHPALERSIPSGTSDGNRKMILSRVLKEHLSPADVAAAASARQAKRMRVARADMKRQRPAAAADAREANAKRMKQARADPSYRMLEALKKRMKRADARRNATAEATLFDLHAASGAMATANSRRLRTLCEHGSMDDDGDDVPMGNGTVGDDESEQSQMEAAYQVAATDAKRDLEQYAHVTIEDKAGCVRAYTKRAEKAAEMHVCAACGLRDLEETYTLRALKSVPDEHWLLVNTAALARLENTPSFDLLRRGENGSFERVTAHRRDLHNMAEVDGRVYHVIKEAIEEAVEFNERQPCIRLCRCCNQGWGNRREACSMDDDDDVPMGDAPAADAPAADATAADTEVGTGAGPMQIDAAYDSFSDLYWAGAPVDSIAGGHDYGRLATLEGERGIAVNVSTLEKLVLAKVRCHLLAVQVVAPGDRKRRRLEGHTINFPHTPKGVDHAAFGEAAIKSAIDAVRPCFVGPSGQQGKLERAALLIDDLRLRPEVLFNFLTIRAALHGDALPPAVDEIQSMLTECDKRARMRANASHVGSDAIVQQTRGSDVAGVRACAQSDAQAHADGEEDSSDDEDDEAVQMEHVGVIEFPDGEMSAVINGIDAVVQKRDESAAGAPDGVACGRDAGGSSAGASSGDAATTAAAADGRADRLELQRGDVPLDDYMGDAEALYGAWWPLFILRRGVLPGKAMRRKKLRHLFCYYDNRFAHDMQLLFHIANTVMRHAVNTAVSVTVKSKSSAFQKFQEFVNDEDFLSLLHAAKQNPTGKEAREVLKRVYSFINLAGKSVPWGSRERAFECTKLMATHRSEGPGSIFYSMAPDGA